MALKPFLYPHNLVRQFASAVLLKKSTGWRHFVPWLFNGAFRSIPVAAGSIGMGCIGYGYHAVWEVTEACNFACRHCHAKSGKAGPDELTTREAHEFIRQVAKIGRFQMLVFTGGEPLVRPDIDDLLSYSKRLGLVNVIATNGSLIDRKRAFELKRLGVKGVAVSFDSTDREIHNYIRCNPQAFDLAVRAIEACKAAGMVVQFNYTAMTENLATLEDVVHLCHDVHADIMLCYQLVPMGRGGNIADSALSPEQNRELMNTIRRLQRDSVTIVEPVAAPQYWPHLLKRDNLDPKRIAPRTLFHGCAAGWGLVYIKPNGDVWPCPFVPVSGGNVREKSLGYIWRHGDIFVKLRDRDQLKGECGKCANRYICGGCRGKAYAATGDPLGEDPTCYIHHTEKPEYLKWMSSTG
ncbi:MAG: radical SAM protein [Thermodesulfobacteriota bacterium]|nr:radical SAM protein [Thermodesulfobacteriota bacterium]